MRILVSAYACEPGKGSEPGVGWNFVKEMSGGDDLTVVTRANNRANIEASGESWTGRVRWIYYDPPRWSTFWKRRNRGAHLFPFGSGYGLFAARAEIQISHETGALALAKEFLHESKRNAEPIRNMLASTVMPVARGKNAGA